MGDSKKRLGHNKKIIKKKILQRGYFIFICIILRIIKKRKLLKSTYEDISVILIG